MASNPVATAPLLHTGGLTAWEAASWVLLIVLCAGVASLMPGRVPGGRATRTRLVLLLSALFVLTIATSPPFHAQSDTLFTVHMVQHMLFLLVAAPLLALARVELILFAYLPRSAPRRRAARLASLFTSLSSPVFAWSFLALVIWLWHAPFAFEAALDHPVLHLAEHTSFLLGGYLFWRCVFVDRRRHHLPEPVAAAMVFSTMLYTNALGGLLALSQRVWYAGYTASTTGLDPLSDQHLAGVVMWVFGTPFFLAAVLWLAYSWLQTDERLAGGKLDTMYIRAQRDESLS